ncbi:MAG: NAD-dependent epimerase/dehydratase family protein [Bacteroidota bacterium]
MRILVTGAGGFIAARLASQLAQSGKKVRAMVRTRESALLRHPNIEIVKGDILDKESLDKATRNVSQVYHVAALANNWAPSEKIFFDINVTGTENVIEAARKNGAGRIVMTSTAGTIGPSVNGQPVHEGLLPPAFLYSGYERSKFAAEELIRKRSKEGYDIVIVNPTRVFGPGPLSKSNSVTNIVYKYTRGRWRFQPGSGQEIGNYAYVDDVIRGHFLAMEKGRSGERYILGGENVSYNQLIKKIAEVHGKEYGLISIPLGAFAAYGALSDFLGDYFGIEPMITKSWLQKYKANWTASTEKAEKELGYTVTPMKEAIARTIHWLSEQYPS